ncbi:MAG: T9SS C-terminal target domain-containing protein [Bacteroidetes bacterium CHB5]|nr:T9SS C-terminal target domain-containing protein [Bacteroidetes bacterium CHB5]
MITITNLSGQQVLKTHVSQNEINLRIDQNGVYIIGITTHNGTTTRKLIISQ